jgi:hypothetical protein
MLAAQTVDSSFRFSPLRMTYLFYKHPLTINKRFLINKGILKLAVADLSGYFFNSFRLILMVDGDECY